MYTRIGLWALVASWIISVPCLAQGDPAVTKENTQLRQRVETLEKQVEQLQATVKPPAAETAPVPAPPAAGLEPDKKPLWSTLDIQFYGYIKLDAAWDSSGVFPGDYVLFTDRGRDGDDEFNITASRRVWDSRSRAPTRAT
jgi:hypothetical protein